MKAIQLIRYGSADKAFRSVEVPKPTLISEDDVLVKVHAFGLNFADVMARKGLYRAAPPIPAILGYEVVGEVVEVKNKNNESLIGKKGFGTNKVWRICRICMCQYFWTSGNSSPNK